MHTDIELYKSTYDKYKNLKLAAVELGIKWQSLYVYLKEVNHPVTGDKERYGSDSDKMAKAIEDRFQNLVPYAKDNNKDKFQAKMDFDVRGYQVDIKSSTKKDGYKNNPHKGVALRWAFSVKVQEKVELDYMVLYCMSGTECTNYGEPERILLIPKEFVKNKQSLSVSCRSSKWYDFEVTETELESFFYDLEPK